MCKIKKIIVVFTLIFSIFLVIKTSVSVKAADTTATKLIIHYFRYDGNYSSWGSWLWQGSASGKDYSFNPNINDTYGIKLEIPLAGTNLDGATSIGILIKQTDWTKDVSADRFIDMTHPDENGVVNAYFVQSDQRVGYSVDDSNGPDKTDKILSAYFSDETHIAFSVTSPVLASDIKVYKNNQEITPDGIALISPNNKGTIILNDPSDVTVNYQMTVHFASGQDTSLPISFNGLYDTQAFNDAFTYTGDDLGVTYTKDGSIFKLWAPISNEVQVCLYDTGAPSSIQTNGDDTGTCTDMTKVGQGVWYIKLNGDYNGVYYTYKVTNGTTTNEVVDPYTVSTGVNGLRGMVLDLNSTDPVEWDPTYKPNNMQNATDAIIYETHIRDLTSSNTWNGNDAWRGKFLGLTQIGTTYDGVSTGLDHLKELGITHVQIMPAFDFGAVDETRLNDPTYKKGNDGIFNWGYMPINYNVPEGSYSTDPYHGEVRDKEFKEMVQSLHDSNIRVIMDVVYNHSGLTDNSNFNQIIPGYYHRMNENGTYSNGSGTGNELATERPMVRKFVLDSVKYWANEYDIDGFRFDLMALIDKTTMTDVAAELHQIDPTILVYGEPWTGGTSTLDEQQMSDKTNLKDIPGVGAFNDDTRDGIKGPTGDQTSPGFIQGQFDNIDKVKYGIVGGVDYTGITGYNVWNKDPNKTINYVACHDNNTLYDKLIGSLPNANLDTIKHLQEQANGIVLTSQGLSFIQEGADFMRSKGGNGNSYNAPDSVNQIDWSLKANNMDVFNYYKGMIALRKAHPAFRMTTADDINNNLQFISNSDPGIIEYTLNDYANNDTWGDILVIDNANNDFRSIQLPQGDWNLVANQNQAGTTTIKTISGNYIIKANETLVLYQGENLPKKTESNVKLFLIIGVALVLAIAGTSTVIIVLKKRA